MSKVYDKSNIEIKAKELLSPLMVTCPDTMWQELSYQLSEHSSKSQNTWTNKLYTPKALIVALAGIVALTIFLVWKFAGGMGDMLSHKATVAVVQKTQAPPVKPVAVPPPAKPVVKTDSASHAPAKDSVKKPVVSTPTNNTPLPQTAAPGIVNTNIPTKIDTAAQRRYYNMRLAYRHRRDSIAAAKKHIVHDSAATRIRADSAGD